MVISSLRKSKKKNEVYGRFSLSRAHFQGSVNSQRNYFRVLRSNDIPIYFFLPLIFTMNQIFLKVLIYISKNETFNYVFFSAY